WIVSLKGAVLHDSGGYGMLGFGHGPDDIMKAMSGDQVMANIMTASFSQLKLTKRLKKEIGFRNHTTNPYARFVCLNSGSEAVTLASRVADRNARLQTDADGPHAGKKIKLLSLKGAFHGRTDRPAQASDSSLPNYRKYLASYRER